MTDAGGVETFETIGDRYDAWHASVGGQLQQASVLASLGDLGGRSVLDAGCGTGYYCRLFAAHGAGQVLGIDLSSTMIAYAETAHAGPSISYRVGDAVTTSAGTRFDLVTALWLVNHAEDRTQLKSMLGGFVSSADDLLLLTTNAHADWDFLGSRARSYGLELHRNGLEVDGRTPYVCTLTGEGEDVTFQSASWSTSALTDALHDAGYTSVRAVEPRLAGPTELLASLPFMILRASVA